MNQAGGIPSSMRCPGCYYFVQDDAKCDMCAGTWRTPMPFTEIQGVRFSWELTDRKMRELMKK